MKKHLLKFMSFWPPYLGAGISVDFISSDFSKIEVSMKLKFWNKNYLNTQFGGSLYSMTDPFFVLILIQRLGPGYIVWDKKASIDFIRPGKSKVFAKFEISDSEVEKIKNDLSLNPRVYPEFMVEITNEKNELIAKVHKTLYVAKKNK